MPVLHDFRAGITPAGAGKTRQDDELREKEIGSPPQVRGKLQAAFKRICGGGITPAGAGKTYRSYDFRQCAEDHPRRCGENRNT